MFCKNFGSIILSLLVSVSSIAQKPKYTPKALIAHIDTSEFKIIHPREGFDRSYVESDGIQLYDLDDDSTTFIMTDQHVMICFEGQVKNNKRNGIYTAYVIDSANHNFRYKIYEQPYINGIMNGEMKIFTLHGTLYSILQYKNDTIKISERNFWIDGKSLMNQKEFLNGEDQYTEKYFYKNGKVQTAIQYSKGMKNGFAKAYYETGILQDSAGFKNDMQNGTRKYFYPNGQVWIEEIYNNGKDWTVVANYTDQGKKRDAGTLHEGTGTVIFYDEDGSVREVKIFVNGIEKR